RSTIFQHVGVMIYVFDIESQGVNKDLEYYRDCIEGLKQFSPDAAVFLLVHKMDLARGSKSAVFEKKKKELKEASGDGVVDVFGTSIYDESLYKVNFLPSLQLQIEHLLQAWSSIVHTLIPNAAVLSKHLATFATACSATEVILFERTTFLVIATSSSGSMEQRDLNQHELEPTRFERTSELVKAFKHSCSRVREEFHSLEMELYNFTAVLDEMTKNTYVLVIVHEPTIGKFIIFGGISVITTSFSLVIFLETAALKLNIRMARKKFEELQEDSLLS
ncbi:hypothetical protein C0993_002404, partial [Termitomyces sp. T159_Od127]